MPAGRRERQRLITEQTAHSNRIKGLLRLWGWRRAIRGGGLAELAEASARLARQPSADALMAELEREHARLTLVGEQLAALAQPQVTETPAAVAR